MKKFAFGLLSLFVVFLFGCVSLESMRRDAENGDETAQVLIGLKYFYGSNDVRLISYDDAARYFKMAEKKENALACYYLGEIYEKGLGQNDVDSRLAEVYYGRAVKNMNALPSALRRHALLALAKMYDFGRGVEQSSVKAKSFYTRAYSKDVAGSAPLLADFMNRSGEGYSAWQLKHILEDAIEENDPMANYMYGMLTVKTAPPQSRELLRKSADANYASAIIAYGALTNNKMVKRNAYEKAAACGYALAFYELALLELREEKRYELLKKSADRGQLEAIEALGDYFEIRKDWNSALIYHYIADRIRNNEAPSPASVRLERASGLSLAVESIWDKKSIPDISMLGSNIDYFIRGHKAGIAKIRENYQKYLGEDPERSYVNMDYVKIFNENMPMLMAGDIFRTYYNSIHGGVSEDFYLNYAIAAGYAMQGECQFYAVEKINLSRKHSMKWHLAKMLLKANALALMGSPGDAYEFLVANYRQGLSDGEINFIIDFVNGNCNMLLKDTDKLSAALNIPAEKFVLYKDFKKQDFFDLENMNDTHLRKTIEEPQYQK